MIYCSFSIEYYNNIDARNYLNNCIWSWRNRVAVSIAIFSIFITCYLAPSIISPVLPLLQSHQAHQTSTRLPLISWYSYRKWTFYSAQKIFQHILKCLLQNNLFKFKFPFLIYCKSEYFHLYGFIFLKKHISKTLELEFLEKNYGKLYLNILESATDSESNIKFISTR